MSYRRLHYLLVIIAERSMFFGRWQACSRKNIYLPPDCNERLILRFFADPPTGKKRTEQNNIFVFCLYSSYFIMNKCLAMYMFFGSTSTHFLVIADGSVEFCEATPISLLVPSRRAEGILVRTRDRPRHA